SDAPVRGTVLRVPVALVPLPPGVLVTCAPTSMHRTWVPPEAHRHSGRLCSAGSGRHPVPRRRRSYAALRLPRPHRPPLRSSLVGGLPRRGCLVLCLETPGAAPPRGHPLHAARRSLVTGSPRPRVHPRRNEGLPGAWAVLFVRAVVEH